MTPGPVQSCETLASVRSTDATPGWPSIFSVNKILSGDSQCSQEGEAAILGVMLRGSPPVAGTTKMSPPTEPSSLISPAMNAMVLPSGDQRGTATCNDGL